MKISLRNDHIREIKRGDIFWFIFDKSLMPCIVLQNDIANMISEYTIIAKMSASDRVAEKAKKIPTIVTIKTENIDLFKKKGNSLADTGFVLTSELYTVPKKQLKQYIGRLDPEAFDPINEALRISLEL